MEKDLSILESGILATALAFASSLEKDKIKELNQKFQENKITPEEIQKLSNEVIAFANGNNLKLSNSIKEDNSVNDFINIIENNEVTYYTPASVSILCPKNCIIILVEITKLFSLLLTKLLCIPYNNIKKLNENFFKENDQLLIDQIISQLNSYLHCLETELHSKISPNINLKSDYQYFANTFNSNTDNINTENCVLYNFMNLHFYLLLYYFRLINLLNQKYIDIFGFENPKFDDEFIKHVRFLTGITILFSVQNQNDNTDEAIVRTRFQKFPKSSINFILKEIIPFLQTSILKLNDNWNVIK